jgi:hypothetical protein
VSRTCCSLLWSFAIFSTMSRRSYSLVKCLKLVKYCRTNAGQVQEGGFGGGGEEFVNDKLDAVVMKDA